MSRIIVKNLPKTASEESLKLFFSQKGQVTDAKIIRKIDGESRQFGFVGFRNEEEAHHAIQFFNNSFFHTSKITCEIARKIGDQDLPRTWSKYSLKTWEKLSDKVKEVHDNEHGIVCPRGQKKKRKIYDEVDPLLQEFLEIMKPRSTSKLWANDTITVVPRKNINVASNRYIETTIGQDISNVTDAKLDVYDVDLLSKSGKKRPQSVVHHNLESDVDYIKSRTKEKWSDSDSDGDDDSGRQHDDTDSSDGDLETESDKVKDVWSVRKQYSSGAEFKEGISKKTVDKLSEAGRLLPSSKNDMNGCDKIVRLFVRNLPYTTTEEELEEHFSKFGNISELHIVVDKETKRSKGIGYIRFSLPESAARALGELDNSIFQGRLLHVMAAKEKTSEKQDMNNLVNDSSKSFKKQRGEERKEAETGGNTQAWNPFYMHSDTVVEYIARKFGVSKNDFLDEEAEDLAVRTALAEAQVISETKKAFAKAGVNITSLEKFAACKSNDLKRSSVVILVKNLPKYSSEGELAAMFGRFGSLDKIILPPTKTLALIIFLEPSEARAAFNCLRYMRYKDIPLYLEWAPSNILAEDDSKSKIIVGENDVKRVWLGQKVEGLMDPDIDHDRIESPSLYVKNLNFKTSDESLKRHFSELVKGGQILSVKVQKHKTKDKKIVSSGYGFIELDSADTAVNICRDLQGTVLDGHALKLQPCHAKEGKTAKKFDNDRSSTKLIIRNVAFEATKRDLRHLFREFGQIKALRVPKRPGNHRGFAFVEYMTKQEAENAFQTLANGHLYGRHLVIERAKKGESLEELRSRTKAQFDEAQNGFLNSAKMVMKRKNLGGFDEDNCADLNWKSLEGEGRSTGECRDGPKRSSRRGKRRRLESA